MPVESLASKVEKLKCLHFRKKYRTKKTGSSYWTASCFL